MNPDEKNLTRKQRFLLAGERLRAHVARCPRCTKHLRCAHENLLWERAVKAGLEVLDYCRGYYKDNRKSMVELVDKITMAIRPLIG